jgi:hypothetical protein
MCDSLSGTGQCDYCPIGPCLVRCPVCSTDGLGYSNVHFVAYIGRDIHEF